MNNLTLDNFIGIYKQAIPINVCESLVKESKEFSWTKFEWTSQNRNNQVIYSNFDNKQIETCEKLIPKYKFLLNPIIENCVHNYMKQHAPNLNEIMGISPIKLNRYKEGYSLNKHIDHIHSLFDGERKGIPTFSVVGVLNNNFEGGNFIFWDNYIVPISIGTIIIFPSNFLYPHRVDTITKGTRYSLVSWVW